MNAIVAYRRRKTKAKVKLEEKNNNNGRTLKSAAYVCMCLFYSKFRPDFIPRDRDLLHTHAFMKHNVHARFFILEFVLKLYLIYG